MKSLSVGEAAAILGLSPKTLRRWDNQGLLIPDFRTEGGHRRYLLSSLMSHFGLKSESSKEERISIRYSRVSSAAQAPDLERQAERLLRYTEEHGINSEEIKDIGSGINYKKKGLQKMLNLILHRKIDTIYVVYRDRLLRFGFDLVEQVASFCGTKILVIDKDSDESFDERLAKDVIEIITVFSAKVYGKRSHKNKVPLLAEASV